jgi:hypothetical protein
MLACKRKKKKPHKAYALGSCRIKIFILSVAGCIDYNPISGHANSSKLA